MLAAQHVLLENGKVLGEICPFASEFASLGERRRCKRVLSALSRLQDRASHPRPIGGELLAGLRQRQIVAGRDANRLEDALHRNFERHRAGRQSFSHQGRVSGKRVGGFRQGPTGQQLAGKGRGQKIVESRIGANDNRLDRSSPLPQTRQPLLHDKRGQVSAMLKLRRTKVNIKFPGSRRRRGRLGNLAE